MTFYQIGWFSSICLLLIISIEIKFFNHVDVNLKPQFLIKRGYYIFPSSSTALLWIYQFMFQMSAFLSKTRKIAFLLSESKLACSTRACSTSGSLSIHGVFSPITTPFHEDESIAWPHCNPLQGKYRFFTGNSLCSNSTLTCFGSVQGLKGQISLKYMHSVQGISILYLHSCLCSYNRDFPALWKTTTWNFAKTGKTL